jgi:hypothetical protein
MQICGYDVPAGTWISLPGAAIGRSTAVYGEDADSFRPDRWISHSSDTDKDGAGNAWAGTGAYDGDDAGGVADQAASPQGELGLLPLVVCVWEGGRGVNMLYMCVPGSTLGRELRPMLRVQGSCEDT